MFCVAERQGFEEGEGAAGLLHPLTHSATHSRDWRDLQLRYDSLHSWEHTGCHLPTSASSHHVDSATQNLARLVWALQPRRCVPWPMINRGLESFPSLLPPLYFMRLGFQQSVSHQWVIHESPMSQLITPCLEPFFFVPRSSDDQLHCQQILLQFNCTLNTVPMFMHLHWMWGACYLFSIACKHDAV